MERWSHAYDAAVEEHCVREVVGVGSCEFFFVFDWFLSLGGWHWVLRSGLGDWGGFGGFLVYGVFYDFCFGLIEGG